MVYNSIVKERTVRTVKEEQVLSLKFLCSLQIAHINNRGKKEFQKSYGKNKMEEGLRELERLEKKFEDLPLEVKKIYDNPATRSEMAMNYYVLPYSVLKGN